MKKNIDGKGTIYRVKDKRHKKYIVRAASYIDSNGKRQRPYIGSASTYKEAKELLDNYNRNCTNHNSRNISLSDMFELWKHSKHVKQLKTVETYKYYCYAFTNTLKPILHKQFIILTYDDYQNLLDIVPMNRSKAVITVLKWIYSEAYKKGINRDNISLYLTPSVIQTRIIKRKAFNDDIVRHLWKIYNENNDEYIAMLLILFYTGMRIIDLKRLLNKNIFLDDRYMITGSKTEAGRDRAIPIHNKIVSLIDKYINSGEFLFPQLTTCDKLGKKFNKILREYNNSKGNLHSIRHTFITKMQQLNIKTSKIKKIVGHAIKDITDGLYTHYSISDLIEVIDLLSYDINVVNQ